MKKIKINWFTFIFFYISSWGINLLLLSFGVSIWIVLIISVLYGMFFPWPILRREEK